MSKAARRPATARAAVTGQGNALLAPRSLVLYGVIAVLFVIIFYLAAHYTVTNH